MNWISEKKIFAKNSLNWRVSAFCKESLVDTNA